MLTSDEKYIAKVMVFFVTAISFILASLDFLALGTYAPYAKIAVGLFACIVLWFGKEKIMQVIVKIVPATAASRSITDGVWSLRICFKEGNKNQERTGTVTFKNSLIGVKVRGQNLLNPATSKTTMNGWQADNAEIITYDNHQVLYYMYKIPSSKTDGRKSEDQYEKIGFVCAIRDADKDVFQGHFNDIQIGKSAGKSRKGTITLYRA
ncbi:hypothetical protein [Janthinobacterium svalbardensis]|uniref:hypothetical protein n=1 Tax=Janthinobacterium svalbardensis TaxID=368607 RepID=UPI002FCDB3E9